MTGSMRAVGVALTTGVAMMLPGVPSWAAPAPVPVVVNPKVDARLPAGTADHLAWMTNSAANPDVVNVVFAARGSTQTTRVNALGTWGYRPITVEGSETIVYQQGNTRAAVSDIYFYNMGTGRRTKVGGKVSTAKWEYWPAASSKYVLFMRYTNDKTKRQLLLYNRGTKTIRTLAAVPAACGECLAPEWVGQTHAIYRKCGRTSHACQLKVLTIGGSTLAVPGPAAPYSQYGASMDEASGDIYFVSSTTYWGLFAELDRWNIAGGDPVLVYDFTEGFDGERVTLAPSRGVPGDVDAFFNQWDVIRDDSDIYELDSVNRIVGLGPAASGTELDPRDLAGWSLKRAPGAGAWTGPVG